jgi:hypothetical protein
VHVRCYREMGKIWVELVNVCLEKIFQLKKWLPSDVMFTDTKPHVKR